MNAPTKIDVPSVTRELAEFAVKLRYEDLPPEVINDAKRCILDSLGCGVFGAKTPWVESVTRVVERLGQSKTASAWGMKVKADPLGVAFINGTAAQGYRARRLPRSVDVALRRRRCPGRARLRRKAFGKYDGKQIILAVVAGFELGTRIGNTVSPHAFHRGFHPCGLTVDLRVGRRHRQDAQPQRRPVCQRARPRRLAGGRSDGRAVRRDGQALPLGQGVAERHYRRHVARRKA